jgi:hypothetical protein
MKTSDDFKPFDDVADSMAAAAARLNVPLAKVKEMKRAGCTAFRGSRVHLGELTRALVAVEKGVTMSEVLKRILEEVATIIADKKTPQPDAFNLTSAVQLGFGVAVLVLEPAQVDEFLRQSAKLCEQIVGSPLRKAATRR